MTSCCESFARSQQGQSHPANDDSVLVDPAAGFFVVADGVSGRPGGAQASRIAVETVAGILRPALAHGQLDGDLLSEAIKAADTQIRQAKSDPTNARMATTLSLLAIHGHTAHLVHVGDSRIYLWRDGSLRCLTEDQTVAAELVRRGHLEPEQLGRHPLRKMLTQTLGDGDLLEPQILELSLQSGDLFVLASDGLGEVMPDEALSELLAAGETRPPAELGEHIFETAAAQRPSDDLTLALVRWNQ